ncbi:hypothetical protein GCM10009665_67920 [Kitasatospora nipponensis]|uniref:NlpC/P60 domain-containing protein n=1 Tax=Kitasatospora nipponensis TaxID=258049 RepID=A0ABP4HNC4_9ACTN
MRIASGPALIAFEELSGEPAPPAECSCLHCAARASRPRVGPAAPAARIPHLNLGVRGTCLVSTVLAGAGVMGLGLGAGTASAEPAPSGPGWDGSRYWFRNASGEWRYTSHYDVYLSRTSGAAPAAPAPAPAPDPATDDGMRQGWDGSRYWFQNASGEWRYTSHYDVYLSRTASTAPAAPAEPSAPEPGAQQPSGTTRSARTEAAIAFALAQLGKPYVWGGDGPYGYDCSGLVQQAFLRAGIDLPRVADDQYAATTPIGSDELRRGDLIFWSDSSRASGIHHVAIYLGAGQYVEAPRPGTAVRISTLSSGYYPTHLGRP